MTETEVAARLDQAADALRELRKVTPKGEWREVCASLGTRPEWINVLLQRGRP